jgi:hypothetical protein
MMYFSDIEVCFFLKMCLNDRRKDYKVFALLKTILNDQLECEEYDRCYRFAML